MPLLVVGRGHGNLWHCVHAWRGIGRRAHVRGRREGRGALVTDACGTKVTICRLATRVFGESGGAVFLGGHPVAGKEKSGVENASKDLFRGSRYGLVTDESEGRRGESVEKFVALVKALGAT